MSKFKTQTLSDSKGSTGVLITSAHARNDLESFCFFLFAIRHLIATPQYRSNVPSMKLITLNLKLGRLMAKTVNTFFTLIRTTLHTHPFVQSLPLQKARAMCCQKFDHLEEVKNAITNTQY